MSVFEILPPIEIDLQPFLSAPQSLLEQPISIQLTLAARSQTPHVLLAVLATSPNDRVAEAAQLHIHWAGEMTEGWQEAAEAAMQSTPLGQNDRLVVELMKFTPIPVFFASEWVPASHLQRALQNPYLSDRDRMKIFDRLSQDLTSNVRLTVAESAEALPAVLVLLAGDADPAVRIAARYNPNLAAAAIQDIAAQQQRAQDWDLDPGQLADLADSSWSWIRLTVAQNPNAPPAVLDRLGRESAARIPAAVALNPSCPPEVLDRLSDQANDKIQAAIATHANTSEQTLLKLLPRQRHAIAARRNLPLSILERFVAEHDCPWNALHRDNTPTSLLAQMVDLDWRRAQLAIDRPQLSAEQREQFLLDSCASSFADIAQHPQVNGQILEHIARHPNPQVKFAVWQNPKTSDSLRTQLLDVLLQYPNIPDPLRTSSLEHSTERDRAEIRIAIAADPATPPAVLEQMGQEELYKNKLFSELRRVLSSDYGKNASFYPTVADSEMASLKHNLSELGIQVETEQWIANIQGGIHQQKPWLRPRPVGRWARLFPALPRDTLDSIWDRISDILDLIAEDIPTQRSLGIALVGNPNTPKAIRKQLAQQLTIPAEHRSLYSHDLDLRLALISNPAIPEPERERGFQDLLAAYPEPIRLKTLARHSKLPPAFLARILTDDLGVQETLAQNPSTPPDRLRHIAQTIAQTKDITIRSCLANNPNTPVDVLLRIAPPPDLDSRRQHDRLQIRSAILQHPNLPPLERYRLQVENEQAAALANANQQLARHPNNPATLAQVVQGDDREAKVKIARDRRTPSEILTQLLQDADQHVYLAAMDNPNLPLEALTSLSRHGDARTRLDLVHRLRNRAMTRNEAQKRPIPPVLLEQLMQDPDAKIREVVATYLLDSPQLLVQLARDPVLKVKMAVAKNPNTPQAVLEQLGSRSTLSNPSQGRLRTEGDFLLLALASNPHTPPHLLARIVEEKLANRYPPTARIGCREKTELLAVVAQNPNTPVVAMELMANATKGLLASYVAAHPNTPPAALEQFIADEYPAIHRNIARRPDSPPELLNPLLDRFPPDSQEYEGVCGATIARSELPLSILQRLIGSKRHWVRQKIAGRADTPVEILEQLLAAESDPTVLTHLARNPNLTPDLLSELLASKRSELRSTLISHPNLTRAQWQQLARDDVTDVRQAVAASLQAPLDALTLLIDDPEVAIRVALAQRASLAATTSDRFAQDESAAVRQAVAANPHTPAPLLAQLGQDTRVEVRRAVARNPNTAAPIKVQLQDLLPQPTPVSSPTLRGLSRLYNPDEDDLPTLLQDYAQSPTPLVRLVTFMHPLAPAAVLQQGAQSSAWLERYAVANNVATSEALRQQLAEDGNRIVRAAALAQLES